MFFMIKTLLEKILILLLVLVTRLSIILADFYKCFF
jgi:hypothetical protein